MGVERDRGGSVHGKEGWGGVGGNSTLPVPLALPRLETNPPGPPCQGGKGHAPDEGVVEKAPLTRGVGGVVFPVKGRRRYPQSRGVAVTPHRISLRPLGSPSATLPPFSVGTDPQGVVEKPPQGKNACGAFVALARNTSLVPNRSRQTNPRSSLGFDIHHSRQTLIHQSRLTRDDTPPSSRVGALARRIEGEPGRIGRAPSAVPPFSVGTDLRYKRSFFSRV